MGMASGHQQTEEHSKKKKTPAGNKENLCIWTLRVAASVVPAFGQAGLCRWERAAGYSGRKCTVPLLPPVAMVVRPSASHTVQQLRPVSAMKSARRFPARRYAKVRQSSTNQP